MIPETEPIVAWRVWRAWWVRRGPEGPPRLVLVPIYNNAASWIPDDTDGILVTKIHRRFGSEEAIIEIGTGGSCVARPALCIPSDSRFVALAHDAPDADCKCGYWALRTRNEALAVSPDRHDVIGRVSLWGRVLEGDRGYRAQYAYPYDLICYDDETAKGLRDTYHVDVTVESRPDFTLEDPPALPRRAKFLLAVAASAVFIGAWMAVTAILYFVAFDLHL